MPRPHVRPTVLFALVGLLIGFGTLFALGGNTTYTLFDPVLQAKNPILLPDPNSTGTYCYATYVTGDSTHFMPSMDAVGRKGFFSLTDGTNTMPTGDTPARAVTIVGGFPGAFVAGTSTGAAQINTCSLAAASNVTNYVAGITVTGGGATSASAQTITLSDGTTTLNFMLEIPAGAGLNGQIISVPFNPPLPAHAANTAWTLTVPSFGTGNLSASANIWGYQR